MVSQHHHTCLRFGYTIPLHSHHSMIPHHAIPIPALILLLSVCDSSSQHRHIPSIYDSYDSYTGTVPFSRLLLWHSHSSFPPQSHDSRHGITVSRHHGITASRHHGITASQHHGITASRHHGITASWHHGIMAFYICITFSMMKNDDGK